MRAVALCAHGLAMPVTRLRVLRQMPHLVPAVCAVLMRGAAVRAPRSGRELVGRAGGIAFSMKLDALLTDFWATGIFGHVLARVHTVRVPLDYL